ncbi:methyltransferase-like protein 13 isoform X1 [Dinothrombium tinctorium]|uniref:Methyltransferase-like protein 13 isoform X1 n=1 Tax=Dinothrombium tinctorium TaxID=1965070 RepID=A0A443RF79_9ACAR|nr:methyltransferase-like protein 13 isoform X1 [Dinothrombium tinctorium]
MNLLPKSSKEFANEEYWNAFFAKRDKSFEWYGNYVQLSAFLHKYIKRKDKVLNVGCGNSTLGHDLYVNGIVNIVNIDLSDLVIKQMVKKYAASDNTGLQFVAMDVFDLKFDNQTFTVVLDKGTLDAIVADGSNETLMKVDKMFGEIDRVLKFMGRYICISLLQSHVLTKFLNWFQSKNNYMIRIHRCFDAETAMQIETNLSAVIFPVFVVVCTKMNSSLSFPFELYLQNDLSAKPMKISNVDEVLIVVNTMQQYAVLTYSLKNKSIPPDSEISLTLFTQIDESNPRYSIFILDNISQDSTTKYAVFIVPQGQETQWLFGSPEGRRELAKMCKTQRLAVVHLNRNHIYQDLKLVQDELSSKVMDYAPKNVKHANGKPIPYLSLGEDVGKRIIKHKGKSEMSGDYVIEDVYSADGVFRRLIFLSNEYVVQSECKLTEASGKLKHIHNYLACRHHYGLFAGIVLQNKFKAESDCFRILLVGFGGGCFSTFIQRNIKLNRKLIFDIVEIDKEMINVAKDWFGWQDNISSKDNIKSTVHITDGIEFIKQKASDNCGYDVILFDVDSKDVEKGLSCPPLSFVEKSFLECVHKLVALNKGIFVLNLVARNTSLKNQIKFDVKNLFPCVYSFSVPEELNEILYCFTVKSDLFFEINDDKAKENLINETVKSTLSSKSLKSVSPISESFKCMKIVD